MHTIVIRIPLRQEDGSSLRQVAMWTRGKLRELLGAWAEGRGGAWEGRPDSADFLFEIVVEDPNAAEVVALLREIEQRMGQVLEYKIDDKVILGAGRLSGAPQRLKDFPDAPMFPAGWPPWFDAGLVTAIGSELHAVTEQSKAASEEPFKSGHSGRQLSIPILGLSIKTS